MSRMALADIQNRSARRSNGRPVPTGLAATLREIDPGTQIRLLLRDGDEIAGEFDGVSGGAIRLDRERQVKIDDVKRLYVAYSEARHAA
jgi:hypothetical protein